MLCACLVMLTAWLAPAPAPGWRLLAAGISLALGWHPVSVLVFQRGRGAVRRFVWDAEGQWRIFETGAGWSSARLAPQSAAFGPWVLLAWQVSRGEGGNCRRLRYALLDAAAVNPQQLRALRGRLTLLGRRSDPNLREG